MAFFPGVSPTADDTQAVGRPAVYVFNTCAPRKATSDRLWVRLFLWRVFFAYNLKGKTISFVSIHTWTLWSTRERDGSILAKNL